ncbi:MAG: phosphatase PAP2 family protein [Myxococcales bacterium]|nr:phosphatase PAP2 family protein [Myxococcales bacterium]
MSARVRGSSSGWAAWLVGASVAVSATLVASNAAACEPKTAALEGYGELPLPTDRLGCNLVGAATGENLLFYGAAVLSTMELSASGADHEIRVFVEERLGTRGFSDFTVSLGYYGLPAMGALVYATGLVARDTKLAGAGAAALQAMTVTFATTVLLKGLTGRPFPNHGGHPESPERLLHPEWAREWRGPLLENSAWPSGHTSVAVALASSLVSYYADVPWLPWVLYPGAASIAFGMMSGAHHWASDVVAGALMGHAIGASIGADFRRMHDARVGRPRVALVPFGTAGLALAGAF